MSKEIVKIYDKIAPEITQVYEQQSHIKGIKKFISVLPKRAKVLDFGCGSGKDVSIFTQTGMEVIGVDASREMIKQALLRHPGVNLMLMDGRNLQFSDKFFDGVWSWSVLTHFDLRDKVKTLKEICRVLKKDGIFTQMVWRGRGVFINKHVYPRPHYLLSTTSWKKIYKDAGFFNLQMKYVKGKGRGAVRLTAYRQ
ncbi:MAG: class I SAM-dependent methyltransferase [bacterium]|nr:class I SAM-dependent methyltransferase [bacterium]